MRAAVCSCFPKQYEFLITQETQLCDRLITPKDKTNQHKVKQSFFRLYHVPGDAFKNQWKAVSTKYDLTSNWRLYFIIHVIIDISCRRWPNLAVAKIWTRAAPIRWAACRITWCCDWNYGPTSSKPNQQSQSYDSAIDLQVALSAVKPAHCKKLLWVDPPRLSLRSLCKVCLIYVADIGEGAYLFHRRHAVWNQLKCCAFKCFTFGALL